MGNIPLYDAQRSPIVGVPTRVNRASATAEAFGGMTARVKAESAVALGEAQAGVGRAIYGFGQELQQAGQNISTIARERQALHTASLAANFDFTPTLDKLKADAAPGAPNFHNDVRNAFDESVNNYISTQKGADGKPLGAKEAAALKARLVAYKPNISEYAANYEYGAGIDKATNDMNGGLDAITNRVRTDPTPGAFDRALNDGNSIIDNLPNMTTDEKVKNKAILQSKLAGAHFEAGIEAAKTPADIEALRTELGKPQWQKSFTSPMYDKAKDALDTALGTLNGKHAGEAAAVLEDMTTRSTGPLSIIPDADIKAANDVIGGYGTDAQRLKWGSILKEQEVFRDKRGLPVTELIKENRAAVNANMNVTEATPFLLSRLVAGHPSYYITNMDARLQTRVASLIQSAPEKFRDHIGILSGARSEADQVRVRKTARRGYAAMGTSQHTLGFAADLSWDGQSFGKAPPEAIAWLREAVAGQQLKLPMGDPARIKAGRVYEPWHVEIIESRGGAMGGGSGIAKVPVPSNLRPLFETSGAKWAFPANILAGIGAQESQFNNKAVSPKGAAGVMGFMPATAWEYGINPTDIPAAIDAAGKKMNGLMKHYKGDLDLALTAYNWGEGNLDKWLADPNGHPMPKEARDYAALVHQKAGDALDRSQAVGVTAATFYTNRARDKIIAEQQKYFNKDTGDMMTYSAGVGNVGISPLDSADAFQQRGKDAMNTAAYFAIPLDEATPLTKDEVSAYTKTINDSTTSAGNITKIMADLQGLGPEMAKAAYRQIGATNPVFGYAASLYSTDNKAATDTVAGQQRIAADPEFFKNHGVTDATPFASVFADTIGNGFNDLPPQEIAAAFKASQANYAETYAARNFGGVDTAAFKASVSAIMGGRVGTVNDKQVLLPPGVDETTMNTAIDKMTEADWTALSANHMPPRYINGDVVPAEDLASEAELSAKNSDGDYLIRMADGSTLTTGRVLNGLLENYVLHADPAKIKEIATRTEVAATPVDNSGTPPYQPFEMNSFTPNVVTPDYSGVDFSSDTPPDAFKGSDAMSKIWKFEKDPTYRKLLFQQWIQNTPTQ